MQNTASPRTLLLLTAVAYLAAFVYEVSYLNYFGIPIAFVDVSVHELLLCGLVCMVAIGIILWLDMMWGTLPRRCPPALAKSLVVLSLVSLVATLLGSLLALIATTLFAFALGRCHARIQTQFAIHDLSDSCAVLRLSSDGYLCVGINFRSHTALGTFRFLDPKGLAMHMLNVGPIVPYRPTAPLIATAPATAQ